MGPEPGYKYLLIGVIASYPFIRPFIGVITQFINGRGPHCTIANLWRLFDRFFFIPLISIKLQLGWLPQLAKTIRMLPFLKTNMTMEKKINLKMYLLLKTEVIFCCYVSFPGWSLFWKPPSTSQQKHEKTTPLVSRVSRASSRPIHRWIGRFKASLKNTRHKMSNEKSHVTSSISWHTKRSSWYIEAI